jgi:hypothetical protein
MSVVHNFTLDGRVLSAQDVALNIYLAFVKDEPNEACDKLWKFIEPKLPADRHARFQADFFGKMKLYYEADTLRYLIAASRKDSRYEQILDEFEKIIFPHPATNDFAEKLANVRAAMADIQSHLDEQRLFPWALQWFAKIGHDETNPATFMALIQLFADNCEWLRKLLQRIRPN